jgi:dTDP-4-amino-4,6-dideoxygalactose transaminase
MNKIPFTRPAFFKETGYFIEKCFKNQHTSGGGIFTEKSQHLLENQILNEGKVLLTTSCTHALEMCAILLNLSPGDEVIVPSYTFVSTGLAFYMHGAKIIFADVRPDTFNIDESKIESLVTRRTKAIVVVHYGGVACEMNTILDISKKYKLVLIEDNAHGLYGKYHNKNLGTIGDLSTLSFHDTKNISCGEGGALIVNNKKMLQRAEIIRDKGTNRSAFYNGEVDKYTWVDKGSSYVMSDILAAALYSQLLSADEIQHKRHEIWQKYYNDLSEWADDNGIVFQLIPEYCQHTGHLFCLVFPNILIRDAFIFYMSENNITATFHYQPLHDSSFGKNVLVGGGNDCPISTKVSRCIARLPLYYDLTEKQQEYIIKIIKKFAYEF